MKSKLSKIQDYLPTFTVKQTQIQQQQIAQNAK
jgi:hypothetical protein